MAEKKFGVRDLEIIDPTGTPTIESSGDLIVNAGGATERLRITSAGQVKITGEDDQDNFIVDAVSGTEFTIHQDATDGEISIRAQDGTGNNYAKYMTFFTEGGSGPTERLRITSSGNLGIGGLTNPGALLSIPAGESNTPRLAIESAVDDNDFTITQYEDGNGTYTMLGQNVKLNSGGNNTILDSGHRTAGILLDARNHGSITFLTGAANAVGENLKIDSSGRVTIPSQPAALVYKTGTTQNFTADGLVTYDATSYNQGGITIGGTRSRMTVPVAGKYMVNACTSGSVTTASSGDGWKIRILKNGTEYNHTYGFPIETTGSATGQELAYTVSMVVDLGANDYVEIQIENVGGAAAQMSYGYFGIYLVG